MLSRLETNKLRNVAKFFAHLLGTDALPWQCLGYIRLTEEDTTSSSRIFIKILFQVCAVFRSLLTFFFLFESNTPILREDIASVFELWRFGRDVDSSLFT